VYCGAWLRNLKYCREIILIRLADFSVYWLNTAFGCVQSRRGFGLFKL
jgi:hypothetical protein